MPPRAVLLRSIGEHMFGQKGVRKITADERAFALCFARTMSVKSSCAAAGFEPRTSFARASRLLERDDVRALVLASIHDDEGGVFPAASADPAPVGSVGDAKDGGDVPVSLDNVRESPAATGGAISTPQKSRMAPKKRA